tara:strand:+ start:14130 stop:16214 length:2085 start_codon:yes stop_codon:yes gene_type:complete
MANDQKKFLQYLNELKTKAIDSDYLSEYKKYNNYYRWGSEKKNKHAINQIKPIIDTKTTLVLDQQVQTVVEERSLNNASFDTINSVKNEASILNDCLKSAFINNSYENLLAKDIVKGAAINGCSVVKVYWDSSLMESAGDVGIEIIEPNKIFFDPDATTIDSCNYIFVKRQESIFELKKKYSYNQEIMERLEKISPSSSEATEQSETPGMPMAVETAAQTSLIYNYGDGKSSYKKNTSTYTIWECYLKDDTILQHTPDQTPNSTKEALQEESFKYPNGRVIIYLDETILEDKAIDYPFGFPFQIFSPQYSPNQIYGCSQIKELCSLQDKLNFVESKTDQMITAYGKKIFIPTELNMFNENVSKIKRGGEQILYQTPPNTTSKGITVDTLDPVDLSSIGAFEQEKIYIENQMMNLARVNKMMISGERPVGVDSGKMVRELNESPMVSIREQQKAYRDFLVGLSNKVIAIIQFYYTDDRIFKTTTGEYVEFSNTLDPETGEMVRQMTKQQYMENEGIMNTIFQITSDASLTDFRVTISTGNAIARSASQTAELTYQLATDPNFISLPISMKKLLMESLDYPNWKALIEEEEKEQQQKFDSETKADILLQRLNEADVKPKELIQMITALPETEWKAQAESIYTILGAFELIDLEPSPPVIPPELPIDGTPPGIAPSIAMPGDPLNSEFIEEQETIVT